jgi:hypothetical protein
VVIGAGTFGSRAAPFHAPKARMRRNKRCHLLRTDPSRNLLPLRGTADRATIEWMRDRSRTSQGIIQKGAL